MNSAAPEKDRVILERRSTINISKVHGDLSPEVVQITVDRLTLILHKHSKSIEKRNSWMAPLGITVSLLLALVTTNFKEFILKADEWSAIFIVATIISGCWLLKAAFESRKALSIEDLVEKIKNQKD